MLRDRLEQLKKELLEFANLVENMIAESIEGLLKNSKAPLDRLMHEDEPKANDLEIVLEEFCTNLIAQYEPKAKDLRTILMILKINNDLERMGDHAVNIAQCGLDLIEKPPVKPLIDIPKMADATTQMLRDSIEAFVKEDAKLAKSVSARDDIVDDLRDQIFRELIEIMRRDPSTVERSLDLIRISQNLERVADLSTNLCEDVIFMVEGRVIKHHRDESNA